MQTPNSETDSSVEGLANILLRFMLALESIGLKKFLLRLMEIFMVGDLGILTREMLLLKVGMLSRWEEKKMVLKVEIITEGRTKNEEGGEVFSQAGTVGMRESVTRTRLSLVKWKSIITKDRSLNKLITSIDVCVCF